MITREDIGWLQWCVSHDRKTPLTEAEFCQYLEAVLNEIYEEDEPTRKERLNRK